MDDHLTFIYNKLGKSVDSNDFERHLNILNVKLNNEIITEKIVKLSDEPLRLGMFYISKEKEASVNFLFPDTNFVNTYFDKEELELYNYFETQKLSYDTSNKLMLIYKIILYEDMNKDTNTANISDYYISPN